MVISAVGHQLQEVVAGHDAGGNNAVKTSHFDSLWYLVGLSIERNIEFISRIKSQ